MTGVTHKLTEAWVAQDYFIWLNNCEVREIDILDLEIMYGGCSVDAVLTIQDTQGHMSGEVDGSSSLQQGGFVRITWTAAGGCGGEFDETFSIENVNSTTNEKNQRILVINLLDTDTKNATGAFKAKNFNNKKPSEIAKEYLGETIKPGIASSRKLVVVPPANENKTSLTFPSNLDGNTFLNTVMKQWEMVRIKDKFTDYIVSKEKTEQNMLSSSTEEFECDPVSPFNFWRVLQYKLDGFDVNALMDSIPMQLSDTSGSTNENGESKDKLAKDVGLVTREASAQNVKSVKNTPSHGVKSKHKNNVNLHQYYNKLSNAQTCSIWVPGLNRNRIGFKCIVNFPRRGYLEQDSYDDTFSGQWEVTAVRDKIIKQYFVQELFLRRVT